MKRWIGFGLLLIGGWALMAPWHVRASNPGMPLVTLIPRVCDEQEEGENCPPPEESVLQVGRVLKPVRYTGLANPAAGRYLNGTDGDVFATFAGRPVDTFIIPEGGLFLDPLHEGGPHYGIDYASPQDYLNGRETYFHPIGPGYVTARADCPLCFLDGDNEGRVTLQWPRYNFGWGGLVLVETPFNASVSVYVLYAHVNRDFVSLGDYVTPDDVIGVVGATGYAQELHLHMEVRFGPPGRFWNADFSQWDTLNQWMATRFVNPALLVFPESHPAFLTAIEEWIALQPHPTEIP